MNNRIKNLDYYTWLGYIALASSNVVIPLCLPDISKTLSTSLTEGGGSETVKTLFAIIIISVSCHYHHYNVQYHDRHYQYH